MEWTHRWRVRTRLPERYGQMCRVLVVARRMNSVLVEFTDGDRVVTSRHYIRRIADSEAAHDADRRARAQTRADQGRLF